MFITCRYTNGRAIANVSPAGAESFAIFIAVLLKNFSGFNPQTLRITCLQSMANSSWVSGKHLAGMMRDNRFTDWESVFIAIDNNNVYGYCTFLKEDYYPENRYSSWISCIFVTKNARGKKGKS